VAATTDDQLHSLQAGSRGPGADVPGELVINFACWAGSLILPVLAAFFVPPSRIVLAI